MDSAGGGDVGEYPGLSLLGGTEPRGIELCLLDGISDGSLLSDSACLYDEYRDACAPPRDSEGALRYVSFAPLPLLSFLSTDCIHVVKVFF